MWSHAHGLLVMAADVLTTVAPLAPQPYDKAITALAQLCRFVAELSQ